MYRSSKQRGTAASTSTVPMLAALWSSVGLLAACSEAPATHEPPDDVMSDVASGGQVDRPPAFVPLHVLPQTVIEGAPDLVLSAGSTSIDTTALTIGGASNPYFVRQGDYTILFVRELAVRAPVRVTGESPLIVAASGAVTISAPIAVGAVGRTPGAGAASGNPGGGAEGRSTFFTDLRVSSGGGGASHGTLGAAGGTINDSAIPAGSPGRRYGMSPHDPLVGGSWGGAGGFAIGEWGAGGAGGGALQISSAIAIRVGDQGAIDAAGGGGAGGGGGFHGGGGGGSGGTILLEAPAIEIDGWLAANGGAGGAGGAGCGGCETIGRDGEDGAGITDPAVGGVGGIPQGSNGGAGAAGTAGMFADANPGDRVNSKGGGGGGGAGRIWLRHQAATPPDLTQALISPPPGLDATLLP